VIRFRGGDNMVKLIITKTELDQIILWGLDYQKMASQAKLPFEPDETRLLEKLRKKYNSIIGKREGV
jgi:hypothetical protein